MMALLRDPRFRRLWVGGAVSDVGLIMYFVVHGWLALSVSDSVFWVGATAGVNGLGVMIFSAFGGILVDRTDRRKLFGGALVFQAAIFLALAILIFTGFVQMWHVLLVAFLDGTLAAVKFPARLALTLDIAGRARLLSATAAVFASMTGMGMAVPLVAGTVISFFDIGWAYVIIGGAYVLAASILFTLKPAPTVEMARVSPWRNLKEGVEYVFTSPVVRGLILMVIVNEAFGWAHQAILPVMARDVLDVGGSGLGYLMSAGSGGATLSLVLLSSAGEVRNKSRLLLLGAGGYGLFLVFFALSPWFSLSMVLLAGAYALAMLFEAALTTLLQTVVPDHIRGRVLSFQTFSFGLSGVSGFHTGAIASGLGAPTAIALGGGVVALNAFRVATLSRVLWEQAAGPEAGE